MLVCQRVWFLHEQWWFSGWWFGTCFVCPYIGNSKPNWRTHIFQRGRAQPPTSFSKQTRIASPRLAIIQVPTECQNSFVWNWGTSISSSFSLFSHKESNMRIMWTKPVISFAEVICTIKNYCMSGKYFPFIFTVHLYCWTYRAVAHFPGDTV